jgi:hypothetical protein
MAKKGKRHHLPNTLFWRMLVFRELKQGTADYLQAWGQELYGNDTA